MDYEFAEIVGTVRFLIHISDIEDGVHAQNIGHSLQSTKGTIERKGAMVRATDDDGNNVSLNEVGTRHLQCEMGVLQAMPRTYVAHVDHKDILAVQMEWIQGFPYGLRPEGAAFILIAHSAFIHAYESNLNVLQF